MLIAGRRTHLITRAGALVALCVLAAGCYWSQPGYDNRRSGYNPHEGSVTAANVSTLTQRWWVDGAGGQLVSSAGQVTSLQVFPTGTLRSVDPADGAPLWSSPVDLGDTGRTSVLVGFDSRLVVPAVETGDPTGCLHLFHLATGAYDRCATLFAPPDSTGAVDLDAVREGAWVAVAENYQTAAGWRAAIAATNTSNSAFRWIIEIEPTGSSTHVSISNPIVAGGMVWAVVYDQVGARLAGWDIAYACTPDCGPPAVEHALPYGIVSGISADPTGATVAVSSDQGLLVVDRVTGDLLWTGTIPIDNSYDHRSIPTWTPEALVVPIATRIDHQFLGETDGTAVLAFPVAGCGSATCAPTWSAELLGRPAGQPAAAADVVYVAATSAFAAFPTTCADVCEPLWFRDDAGWLTSPIITHGRVLHSPGDRLEALGLP